MGPDYSKLSKILVAERESACEDRVVIGGLDKFLAGWLREARATAGSTEERDAIDHVAANLQGYSQKALSERMPAVEDAIGVLQSVRQGAAPEGGAPIVRDESGAASKRPREAPGSGPSPNAPVTVLRGVGASQAKRLERLGVRTIEDLLYLFPRRYDDYSQLRSISQIMYGEEVTVIGVVQESHNQTTKGGMPLTKALVSDGTGAVEAVWFNQPYLLRQLQRGRRVVLSGRVDQYLGRLTFQSPQWEPFRTELLHTGRLVPLYPLTEGLSARRVRTLVKNAVEQVGRKLADPIPVSVRQGYELVDLATALQQMHFPDDRESLIRARQRLAFGELLLVQLGVLKQRQAWREQSGRPLQVDQERLDAVIGALPFTLTSEQRKVLAEITHDLQQTYAMSRLLQGDVGSVKTVVALAAMLVAVWNGTQAVIMAPTEILAEQHFRTVTSLLDQISQAATTATNAESPVAGVRVGLLTGSLPEAEKAEQHARIRRGEVNIIVGTHALIQEGVDFHDMGLVVVDEQHRFGVAQRGALRQKGENPHVLIMSATPIPRSLALTLYGDLDLSTIGELPPNRQQITTKWLAPPERERAYSFVRNQVQQGRQAFIICPLIDESEKIEAKAAVSEYRRLKDKIFPDLRLALLHGRMASTDKELIMKRYGQGEYDILVSTPVVEVGIDVPNATVMLVEGADRFGLAQLHQFRGRVGRGEHPSFCLLLAETPSFEAEQRLLIIEATDDGFALAEEDLKLRGPGEFFGTRQSGLPDLRVARLGDLRILESAREAAQGIFGDDPALTKPQNELLGQKVAELWSSQADLS